VRIVAGDTRDIATISIESALQRDDSEFRRPRPDSDVGGTNPKRARLTDDDGARPPHGCSLGLGAIAVDEPSRVRSTSNLVASGRLPSPHHTSADTAASEITAP